MKQLLLAGCLVAGLAAPALAQPTRANAPKAVAMSAPLAALFTNYWEEQARLYPLQATAQGDNRYNDQLPNSGTRDFREQQRSLYARYQGQLARIDRRRLGAADQTSYDVFQYEMTTRLAGLKQPTWTMPFTQFSGLPIELAQLGAGTGAQPFKTVQDYDNWLTRVRQFPAWADTAVADFRQGMRTGVVLPKVLVQKMIPQLEALAVADPTQSVFYGPIKQLPASFSAADKQRLIAAYEQAIRTQLVPALGAEAAATVFVKVLVTGKAALYTRQDRDDQARYYLAMGTDSLRELRQYRVPQVVEDRTVYEEKSPFRTVLANAFRDCLAVQPLLPRLALTASA
ncbi:MAG: DUF885 family protein, partial [Hymenobacter sp.]